MFKHVTTLDDIGKDKSATRQFTDREELKQTFTRMVEQLSPQKHCVLVNYGIGGIGKSALQEELTRLIKQKKDNNLIWSRLNFEDYKTATAAVRNLRFKLGGDHKIPFYAYDVAYAIYWRKANPDIPMDPRTCSILEHSDTLVTILTSIESIPVIGAATKIAKASREWSGLLKSWWNTRGKDELKKIMDLEQHQIEAFLPIFFAADLNAYIQAGSQKLVIFLDTHELLWDNSEARSEDRFLDQDKWLREMIKNLPGILWYISGREKLRWEQEDPYWNQIMEQHLIDALSAKDIAWFLKQSGVQDPELIQAIIDSSEGVPFYLDLALDTIADMEAKGNIPSPKDFSGTHKDLYDRFKGSLEKDELSLLKHLAVSRFWDKKICGVMIEKFTIVFNLTRFRDLIRFSFVEQTDKPDTYTFHNLMQRSLVSQLPPDEICQIHQALFEYYNEKIKGVDSRQITDLDILHLEEAFYHAKGSMLPDDLMEWYLDAEVPFEAGAKYTDLVRMLTDLTAHFEATAPKDDENLAVSAFCLGNILIHTGRYKEAEKLLNQSFDYALLSEDEEGQVDILLSLSGLKEMEGKFLKAEEFCRNALSISIRVNGEKDIDTSRVRNQLALILNKQGRFEEAEPLFKSGLETTREKYGEDDPDTANMLNNLAMNQMQTDQKEEAAACLRQAIEISERHLPKNHPNIANMQINLATLLVNTENPEDAEPLCRSALKTYEEITDTHNFQILNANDALGLSLSHQGRYKEAKPILTNAWEIKKELLGEDNVLAFSSLPHLGQICFQTGDLEASEKYYDQSYQSHLKHFGSNHHRTQLSLEHLMDLYDNIYLVLKEEGYTNEDLTPLLYKALGKAENNKAVLPILNRLIEFKADDIVLLEKRGTLLCQEFKDYDLAISDFNRILQISPGNITALFLRSQCRSDLMDYTQALKDIDCAISSFEEHGALHVNRAQILYKLRKFHQALEACNRAVTLSPELNFCFLNRGIFFYGVGKTDLALADFSKTLALSPDHANALEWRATAIHLENKKDYDAALTDINRAIELDMDNTGHYFWRAIIMLEKSGPDQALADLNFACKKGPFSSRNFLWRGVAFKLLGDDQSAGQDWDRIMAPEKDFGNVYNTKFYRCLAKIFAQNENLNLSYLEEALVGTCPIDQLRTWLYQLKGLYLLFPDVDGLKNAMAVLEPGLADLTQQALKDLATDRDEKQSD